MESLNISVKDFFDYLKEWTEDNEMGTFISRDEYFVNAQEEKFEDLVNNRDLVNGDKVFFLPGTSLPRYKFKEVGDEVGFKAKRKISKYYRVDMYFFGYY